MAIAAAATTSATGKCRTSCFVARCILDRSSIFLAGLRTHGPAKIFFKPTPTARPVKRLQVSSHFACKDFWRRSGCEFYGALTTLAHHCIMKTRDNRVVIGGLQRDHGLLAAYLEATNRIDWRPLHKRAMIAPAPEPVDVESHTASTAPQLPKVVSSTPFVFPRANLVPTSGKTQLAADGVGPISLEREVLEPPTRVLRAGYLWPILKGARRVLLPVDRK